MSLLSVGTLVRPQLYLCLEVHIYTLYNYEFLGRRLEHGHAHARTKINLGHNCLKQECCKGS